jgi:exonuclease SbcC
MNKSLSKIEIRNFQSHEHTILELDPDGINILTGTSNAGKSAINRAIFWALSNKPRGDYFIRKGKNFASVKLTYPDGSELLRLRGTEENSVKIKYANGTVEKYEKFGADYPEPVKKFLSMPRDSDILGSIYYAEQMSNLFFVDLPPADLPRAIGYLAGSDVMESAIKSMMQESRQIKRDVDKLNGESKKTEIELRKFTKLDSKLLLLENCKEIKSQLVTLINQKESITNQKTAYHNSRESIDDIQQQLNKLDKIALLGDTIEGIKDKYTYCQNIATLIGQYKSCTDNMGVIQDKMSKFNSFFKSYKKQNLKELKGRLELLSSVGPLNSQYKKLTGNIQELSNTLEALDQETTAQTKQVKIWRKQLLGADYICKTCGQKITK